MKKRILSLALALCMMLSVMPTSYAGNGVLTLGDSDVQQENPVADTPVENAGPSLTLDGIGSSEKEPQEQPVEEKPVYGVLTPDGFETENREEVPEEPVYGVLTPDEPIEDETDNQSDWEDNEPAPGVLYFQCDFCGYLDGNHADHCPTLKTEDESEDDSKEEPEAVDISTIKATLMSAKTYQDIFDALMSSETLDEFESILDELAEDKLEEFYDLLSDDDLDALNEQEDALAQAAIETYDQKAEVKKTVTVEKRASLFGAAQREVLRQLGYELIVNIFGSIVESIDLPQNDYTMLEAVTPAAAPDYQWQILADDDLWVDIYNENEAILRASYAMVASLLDRSDTVWVRCEITGEDGLSYTDPVEIVVDYTWEDIIIEAEPPVVLEGAVVEDVVIDEPAIDEEPVVEEPVVEEPIVEEPIVEESAVEEPIVEEPIAEEPIIEEPIIEEPVAQTFSITRLGGTYAQPFNVALLANETPELKDYTVVINYVFENTEVVADPYTATLAAGSNFKATVTHPTVMGYLPYVGTSTETSVNIELDITNIQKNVTYTVTYKPTNVNYTVIHYQQNVDNDNYVIKETETKQGLTKSVVPEVAKNYEGFYALLYEKPEIAADGSTVVEVYYDRNYYLINFDLDGGYGVEPIYARYGAPISVGTPTRVNHTFTGWSPAVPSTVPVNGGIYEAQWTTASNPGYMIVYWRIDVDDNNPTTPRTYSYWGSKNVQNVAAGTVLDPAAVATANPATGAGFGELVVNVGNMRYNETQYFHYNETMTVANNPDSITVADDGTTVVNVYYDRNVYEIRFLFARQGTNTTSSYQVSNLTRNGSLDQAYGYYSAQTVSNAALPTTGDYTRYELTVGSYRHYYIKIEAEYGADISAVWPANAIGKAGTWTFGSWAAENTSPYRAIYGDSHANIVGAYPIMSAELINNPANPLAQQMVAWWAKPGDNAESHTYHIYVEALPGQTPDRQYNGKGYVLDEEKSNTFICAHNTDTRVDPWAYEGYTCINDTRGKNPDTQSSSSNYKKGSRYYDCPNNSCAYCNVFYYDRVQYDLVFKNGDTTSQPQTVPYGKQLGTYNYTPTQPSIYPPGSVVFGGWYENEECAGEPFVLRENTMPAHDVLLYAKWAPAELTVSFYKDKAALDAGTKLLEKGVPYGTKTTAPGDVTNSGYKFVGWFYMENGMEKAFDFDNMAITKDMQVYGKWSSNTLKEYTVYFKIQGTDTQIAAPITGSGLAGVTKTFEAKGGTDLDAGYQEGYFPLVQSHSMTLNIDHEDNDGDNTFTFWYVQKDAVPYKVYYVTEELPETIDKGTVVLDGKTYYIVADTKEVNDNRKAVVTEKFEVVPGYMPDAYQKRLVVDGTNGAVNEIIFYYSVDTQHAYYKITHYIQNTDGADNYTEYASSEAVGDIGQPYSASPLTIDGFTYAPTVAGSLASGTLEATGLELKLYYTRNSYPYKVRYLEEGTGKLLAPEKTGSGLYGAVVPESPISITNYTYVSATPTDLIIRIESSATAALNIITFYYEENDAVIRYEIVGDEGCGTVTPAHEDLKVLSSEARGSTATANADYTFVGWYDNVACTGNPLTTNAKYVPTKEENDAWEDVTTYYAKFVENEVTINYEVVGPEGCGDIDRDSETLKVLTGNAQGSTAAANEDYTFVGWYLDEACTQPVNASWVNENHKLVPAKVGDKNVAATYYAKFVENEVTINYKGVTPDGTVFEESAAFGTVTPNSESVKVLTGTTAGSTAAANTNYRFVGWYLDEACTQPVNASWVNENHKLVPAKVEGKNVAATYYAKFEEIEVTINYVAIGPEGENDFGSVNPTSEDLKVLTGVATGSTAAVSSNAFKFVGWYSDRDCTQPVDASWVDGNNKLVPTKAEGTPWVDGTTYYAKFEWNLTNLTIKKTWTGDSCYYQDAIFTITGNGLNLKVVIPASNSGEGTITISGLTVGQEYTISEDGGWSWRYTPDSKTETLVPISNEVEFTNELNSKIYWLDGSDYKKNKFGLKSN